MPCNIGVSYVVSIGRTYGNFLHALAMQDATKKSFWDRVLEALADRGIDRDQQTVVAEMIGIKQPSVWEWTPEGKSSKPSMKNALKLAGKLDVCVEWLLTGRGTKWPIPSDPLAQELWDIWQKSPNAREKIVSYARFAGKESSPFEKTDGGATKAVPAKSSRITTY